MTCVKGGVSDTASRYRVSWDGSALYNIQSSAVARSACSQLLASCRCPFNMVCAQTAHREHVNVVLAQP